MTMIPSRLVAASAYRYEYVARKGTATFSAGTSFPSNQPVVTIAHNLGYAPFFRLFYSFGGAIYQLFPGNSSYGLDGNQMQVDNVYADTTNVYVSFFNNSSTVSYSGKVYYRIYGEPQA